MAGEGRVVRVNGPLVVADGMRNAQMFEVVEVGELRLVGEITRIEGDRAYIQVYEATDGIKPGEKAYRTGSLLSVELGPGLMGGIFDGLQRPLDRIAESVKSPFVTRGVKVPALERNKKWHVIPVAKKGDKVSPGDIIAKVNETDLIEHRIIVPPNVHGTLKEISPEGDYTVEDVIARVDMEGDVKELKLYQRWPVRIPRPFKEKLEPTEPLLTGTRVVDTIFPIAKGGTAAIPGPFGSGKTVTLQSLAKWSEAKVVIYVGCGERGNEMTDELRQFPKLKDPWTGKPLLQRTILVANTSNMPVAARESSIYVGVTMAEYFRDQGYDVLLVADSTSRWAEALRELGGRMEEMPAEEGFPSYLPSRLAEYYERAGRVIALGKPERFGSVSIASAVSPPGGDFTEPVTSNTLRFVRVFWPLDVSLAQARHYPAINWIQGFSAYVDLVASWWHKNVDPTWFEMRSVLVKILLREDELRQIVRLVGPESLSDKDKLILEASKLIRDAFLKQNAFDDIDAFSSPQKQAKIMRLIYDFYTNASQLLDKGLTLKKILEKVGSFEPDIVRVKYTVKNDELNKIDELDNKLKEAFDSLLKEVA
ncbi:ATP synthase subunit A [Sulfolobus acidocaldarius]|uniref:A-type ATP synthase subunit A n=4 Tax=Sulfolobus acidocaldarius TaxID=2285 RepID=AATA_SULAC|nr:ATP synthase subunit A [Sulfolobus acidocaldarius]Q4J8L9.1 RecName: Full=V-type ATP synthase alpha chain; AltName: Full=V-ATPase subunit A [Sulfolobus acidocaldarius DSM 639]AAY80861.1 V-type ATP synthase alpha chain [Sulfolobus acidocaldarius DSM 639]AGE71461.1 V-type ATP synthase subunit A [Sulfolobus acidocaldarius N8]AGE73734.1 V-type ATP synthase subunit A [Sulfolobus acidocaldarius Ron12/I]ALU30304.1 ATP synthase subunit A [Sulfolobus acidocaldarius]ALU31022.1 ATP synthase subunit A 